MCWRGEALLAWFLLGSTFVELTLPRSCCGCGDFGGGGWVKVVMVVVAFTLVVVIVVLLMVVLSVVMVGSLRRRYQ